MDTKEAIDIRKWIEFLKSQRDDHFVYESLTKDYNKVILLLKRLDKKSKRGEKYEKMFSSIKYDMCRMEEDNWLNTIYDLEQKYFPKGINNDTIPK